MTGKWPVEIDHRNGDRLDDRWDNLREATRAQNEWNKGANRNNRCGMKGIDFRKNRWRMQIMRNGQRVTGRFRTIEEARAAYLAIARQNDGEFLSVR